MTWVGFHSNLLEEKPPFASYLTCPFLIPGWTSKRVQAWTSLKLFRVAIGTCLADKGELTFPGVALSVAAVRSASHVAQL